MNSFRYAGPRDIHTMPMDDIVTLVDPQTRSGHVYSLTKEEIPKGFALCHGDTTVRIYIFFVFYGISTPTKFASSKTWSNLCQIYGQTEIRGQSCC